MTDKRLTITAQTRQMFYGYSSQQEIKGLQEYGQTLDDAQLTPNELLAHSYEELADLGHYITALHRKCEQLENERNHFKTLYEQMRIGL